MFRVYTRETLDHERWAAFAQDYLFNQPDWLMIWETVGARPLFFLSSSSSSGVPAHAFSCLQFGTGLWSRAQASVDGLAARLCSDCSDSHADCHIEDNVRDEIFRALKKSGHTHATWVDYETRMNPENPPRGWSVAWIETHRLDISSGPPMFSAATRRHINSGLERGAAVSEINDLSQVERCYALMQETYQQFGRRRMYPQEFYRKLFDYSRIQRRIRWYVCQVDGKIIGSLITLIERNEALSWQPFIDRRWSAHKPAYLMLSRLIENAAELRLSAINLGGSPPGAHGLVSFKERFGAKPFRYPVFVSQAPWYHLYKSFLTWRRK